MSLGGSLYEFYNKLHKSFSLSLYSPMGVVCDVTSLSDALPPLCRDAKLSIDQIQFLEYEFHSCNYHVMRDIVNGLKTAVGLLIRVYNVCYYSVIHVIIFLTGIYS